MNWIDVIIIAILLIFMAFGIKKGFMFSVIDTFGIFVNFIIACFLTGPIRSLLGLFGMETGIANAFATRYAGFGDAFTTNLIEYQQVNGNVTDFVNEAINNSPMNGFSKKLFNGTINNHLADKLTASAEAGNTSVTLSDIMSKSLAQFFTVVTAFVVSFILIYVVLLILRAISKQLQKSRFINVFDKIFGAGFGLLKGFLLCVVIFAVLSFFSDNGLLGGLFSYINQSALGSWLRTSVNTFMVQYIDIKQFIIDLLQKL